MSFAFLAATTAVPPPASETPTDRLYLTLESPNGARRVVLDGSTAWTHMPGSVGLEMPPVQIHRATVPGVHGSQLQDVRVEERLIGIPLFIGDGTGTQSEHLARMDALRSIVDPMTGMFRIIGATSRSERELMCIYTGGLEGDDAVGANGMIWNKVVLSAIACQPFAQDRTLRSVEFSTDGGGSAFIGAVGGTDAIWPTGLGTAAVIGDNMQVDVVSEVPVYPTVELVGPMDSFTGSLSPVSSGAVWSVSVPGGLAAGETFRMVTDPRARSFRVNGALAAGRVARGSQLRPFYPGVNVMDVSAPGATSDTRVRISWRELYRSLW